MSKRPGFHPARVNKGHPRRRARRDRAAERLAAHVTGRGCGPNCPARKNAADSWKAIESADKGLG